MEWQDIVLSVGSWVFAIALIPSVIGKDKPALATSLSTGIILLVYAAGYVTRWLWSASISTFLVAAMWLTLAVQKVLMLRRARKQPTEAR